MLLLWTTWCNLWVSRCNSFREQGRRRRGRPRLKREDCVKRDVRKAREEEDWKKKTRGIGRWKRLSDETVKKLRAAPHPWPREKEEEREFSIAIFLACIPMLAKSCLNYTWRDSATSQAYFVLDKTVSLMWFRFANFDNRPGASFESNHAVAMKQCSHVDSPSTSRKISFAWRSAFAGKSEKNTQRRIDSFRFTLPPPMTVKEDTSDGLTATTEKTPTTRQQDETHVEPQLNHRPPTEHQDWHILGLGFRTTGEVLSLPQETVWKVEDCLQKLPGCMVW